jgi:GTPase-activating protein
MVNCKIYEPKGLGVEVWKLINRRPDFDTDQNPQVFNPAVQQDEPFLVKFDGFLREYLDNAEIKITIYDQADATLAYHYVSLRHLYLASKKGHDVWLCMTLKEQNGSKFPLLHLKVKSHFSEKLHRLPTIIKEQPVYDKDFIEDSFFSYKFKMPLITPKQTHILECLPKDWGVLDEATKSLLRNNEFGKYIQRIKYNLFRNYHQNTSRQLARLKHSAYTWAELQDELAAYEPPQTQDKSQIWISEDYIKNLTTPKKPQFGDEDINAGADHSGAAANGTEFSGVISYLFKRDKWESKEEWKTFYDKLKKLCQKGMPPQNRMTLWSELGRVVYFINLTESHHKKQIGLKRYKQGIYGIENNGETSQILDNIYAKSKNVYENLKKDAEKENIYLYQELEDDIAYLRDFIEVDRLPYETSIRSICRTFIFWSKLFSDRSTEENIRYFVTYSRSILNICYGLVVCQSCSYLESNIQIEEDQVFWLLISLSTYILSSYFESNEKALSVDTLTAKPTDNYERRRNTITDSALRCHQMRGIKSDLLMLKVLLKESEPEIYNKFEEFGLPLEYYFADHMTTLFFNLFNPGLTFRLWDILFFEGSSSNQVRCNRMVVCILFQLLKECKPMILKAKKSKDINFIIEIYAKFQTRYGHFIKGVYSISEKYFEQSLPSTESLFDKLNFIRYALFTNEYNRLDKKIRAIEKKIEAHYHDVYEQNMAFYALANTYYHYVPNAEDQPLSFPILSRIIKNFLSYFGVQSSHKVEVKKRVEEDYIREEFSDAPQRKKHVFTESAGKYDPEKFLTERISRIHFKIHRLSLYWPEVDQLSIYITYGKDRVSLRGLSNLSLNLEGEFTLKSTRDITRYILIELYDEKDPRNPVKVKYASIDLKGLPVDSITKHIIKFNEDNNDIPNNNYVASEIELSIVLTGIEKSAAETKNIKIAPTLIISDFENVK